MKGLEGLLAGLAIAAVLFTWGAHAIVPLRMASRRADPAVDPAAGPHGKGRRRWAYAALPLLLAGAAAALLHVQAHPDAAIAVGLLPLFANLPGRLIALLFPAVLLADAVLLAGREKLENAGWRIAGGFGLLLLAAASLAGELLRMGEGPASALPLLIGAAGGRLAVGLAAGEALAPGRPLAAPLAGIALPVHFLLLPGELQQAMIDQGAWLTLGAAAMLLLVARWVPARLRRPALAAGVLLAGLALGKAAELSQTLAGAPLPPVPSLPVP